jgi:hypothetical protein
MYTNTTGFLAGSTSLLMVGARTRRREAAEAASAETTQIGDRPAKEPRGGRPRPVSVAGRSPDNRIPTCRSRGRRVPSATSTPTTSTTGQTAANTDLSNLLRLCSHHHRLLHEGGYTIKRGPRGALHFHRPDGIALPTTLPPITGQLGELRRANTDHGLDLTDQTCRPHVYPDRLDLHWIVDNLAETDGRLSGVGS